MWLAEKWKRNKREMNCGNNLINSKWTTTEERRLLWLLQLRSLVPILENLSFLPNLGYRHPLFTLRPVPLPSHHNCLLVRSLNITYNTQCAYSIFLMSSIIRVFYTDFYWCLCIQSCIVQMLQQFCHLVTLFTLYVINIRRGNTFSPAHTLLCIILNCAADWSMT